MTLVELADHASWAHVIWLLRGVFDQAASGSVASSDGPEHDELFSLADACAALVDAPVTIEDTRSRVVAHSARQDVADPIRLSTIVGRKVPDSVLASLRGRGVFRRLARSDEPVYVPADGQLKPRLVIPVRAGQEWLGSIWAVVEGPPDAAVVRSLSQTASVVALHLLRQRSQADLARRVAADRLRAVLTGDRAGAGEHDRAGAGEHGRARAAETASAPDHWMPPGPWRVVVLDGGPGANPDGAPGGFPSEAATTRVDLWESAARRRSWRQPLLTVHDGLVLALVTDAPTGPPGRAVSGVAASGSWVWLQEVVREVAAAHPATQSRLSTPSAKEPPSAPPSASAGGRAVNPDELDRSRREAVEVHRQRGTGRVASTTCTLERAWAAVSVARCAAALHPQTLLGPVRDLVAHDEAHHSAYAPTIAAWLDHPGDPRAAAKSLHVHVNTLRYRLQRLTELIEATTVSGATDRTEGVLPLDLHDPETRLALRLQLRALGY